MKKLVASLFLASFVLAIPSLRARTIYNTIYNHFCGLSLIPSAAISQDFLMVHNTTTSPQFLLDTTVVSDGDFSYYMRVANENNEEGKRYTVFDKDGKKRKLDATSLGIVLNYRDDENYDAIKFECSNIFRHNDILERRIMNISVARVAHGQERVITTGVVDHHIKKNSDFNVFGIHVEKGELCVLAGENELLPVFDKNFKFNVENHSKLGCYVGPGAKIKLERSVLTFAEADNAVIVTPWTAESLNEHFLTSKDPFEGYWVYLDRETEDKWLRLGGRYTVALVKSGDGYDIIYVDGAKVKKRDWRLGLLKGKLTATIFTDHYNGFWVDATFRSFSQDVYADFESGVVLALKFPVYNSQIRFSKVLDQSAWPQGR